MWTMGPNRHRRDMGALVSVVRLWSALRAKQKPLKQQSIFTYRLAKRLLETGWLTGICAWMICAMTGCFIPPDDGPLPEPPASRNRPPRIVESSALPAERTKVIANGTGCRLEFSAYAEDPDIDDRLTVNWYVDYDANSNPSNFGQQKLLQNNGSTVRSDPATLSIDFSTASALAVGPHLIEVLVSDGLLVNRVPQPRVQSDGGIDPTYVGVWSWEVVVENGSCP